MTHGVGAEPDTAVGAAETTNVTVRDRCRSSCPVAKRCLFCGALLEAGSSHSRAIVDLERTDGEPTTRFSAFCDADCLDEWVSTTADR